MQLQRHGWDNHAVSTEPGRADSRDHRPQEYLRNAGAPRAVAGFRLLYEAANVSRWLGVITGLDRIDAANSDVAEARTLHLAVWNAAHDAADGRTGPSSTGRPDGYRRSRRQRPGSPLAAG